MPLSNCVAWSTLSSLTNPFKARPVSGLHLQRKLGTAGFCHLDCVPLRVFKRCDTQM